MEKLERDKDLTPRRSRSRDRDSKHHKKEKKEKNRKKDKKHKKHRHSSRSHSKEDMAEVYRKLEERKKKEN